MLARTLPIRHHDQIGHDLILSHDSHQSQNEKAAERARAKSSMKIGATK